MSWETETDSGQPFLPLGQHPVGRIQYQSDGHMFAVLIAANRPVVGWSSMLLSASQDEKAEAYDSQIAYYGTYKVEGDKVLHYVTASSLPALTGSTIERRYQLEGATLVLGFATRSGDKEYVSRLVWRRA